MFKRVMSVAAVVAISLMSVSSPAIAQSSSSSPVFEIDQNNNSVIINQGDRIQTDDFLCTLAYVGSYFAITAAHCTVSQGDKVYTSDKTGRKLIGYYDFLYSENHHDVAIIKLEPNVTGENIYSGDKISSLGEMKRSDELCQFGYTTQEVLCGPQTGFARYGSAWTTRQANFGDSGGPVWIPGKGLIGVIALKMDIGTGVSEAWLAANEYGITENMAPSTTNWVLD